MNEFSPAKSERRLAISRHPRGLGPLGCLGRVLDDEVKEKAKAENGNNVKDENSGEQKQ